MDFLSFEDGEIASLFDAGITSLSTEMQENQSADGRMLMQSSATTADGETLLTEDVWFMSAEDAGLQEDVPTLDEVLDALPEQDAGDVGKTAISADSGARDIGYDSGSREVMEKMQQLFDEQPDQGNEY